MRAAGDQRNEGAPPNKKVRPREKKKTSSATVWTGRKRSRAKSAFAVISQAENIANKSGLHVVKNRTGIPSNRFEVVKPQQNRTKTDGKAIHRNSDHRNTAEWQT